MGPPTKRERPGAAPRRTRRSGRRRRSADPVSRGRRWSVGGAGGARPSPGGGREGEARVRERGRPRVWQGKGRREGGRG